MFIGIRVGEMDSASSITSTYFNIVLHKLYQISTLSHLSFQIYHDKGYLDTCIFKSEWVYGCSDYDQQEPLLYCLRVYLDTVYPEPAPERLDPPLSPSSRYIWWRMHYTVNMVHSNVRKANN